MDMIVFLRTFFITSTILLFILYFVPDFRSRFLAFGARGTPGKTTEDEDSKDKKSESDTTVPNGQDATDAPASESLQHYLDVTAQAKVPHSWFYHFYVVSVISSTIWMQQLINHGALYERISLTTKAPESSMTLNQIALCSSLVLIQGFRRLSECLMFTKPSKSQMWVGHWILGIVYYIAVPIAIWVEGLGALRSTDNPLQHVSLEAPSIRTMIFVPGFLLASGVQNDCHRYLASLKKYTLPSHPAFITSCCPHYSAECVYYLSLMFLAAPRGCLINGTMATVFMFVLVNQGISADLTREWYIEKFGKEQVGGRPRMIPYVW